MKHPTLFGGIVFAFLSAVFAAPLWWGLSLVFPFGTALRLVAAAPPLPIWSTWCELAAAESAR